MHTAGVGEPEMCDQMMCQLSPPALPDPDLPARGEQGHTDTKHTWVQNFESW